MNAATRSLEQAWLKEHGAEYAAQWVALEGTCLIAAESSAREALEVAKSKGYDQPLLVHVPSNDRLPFGGW